MAGRPPGSRVSLGVARWDGEHPVEGDFLRTRAGSCYLIEEIRMTGDGSRPGRLICTKLEQDAVAEGEPGVWLWAWNARKRSAAA